jgi:uncharacterized protein
MLPPPQPPTSPAPPAAAPPPSAVGVHETAAHLEVAQPLDPAVRTLWFVGALVQAFVMAMVAMVALLVVWAASDGAVPSWVSVTVAAMIAVGLSWLGWWHSRAAYERWRWTLTGRALELRHGVIWRQVSAVPYTRLQQIDVEQGPIERRLGIVTLKLRTAAATSDGTIPGITAGEADAVRARILERAGRGDAV